MTPLWTAAELLEATGGRFETPFDATGVSIDTRSLRPGDLFVALVGESGDGHDHIGRALAAGAAGVMVHRDAPALVSGTASAPRVPMRHVPVLRVDDTLAGLTRLGAFARARFTGRVVAVTGSVGKTTTKEMLRVALSAFGAVHAAVASYNNHWGVPLTLARAPREAAFCVVEIGMNHAGEIAPLARLAAPHVAVITTIEAAHIGYLGGLEAIAEEKAAILRGLDGGAGQAVLPAESPWFPLLRARAAPHQVLSFGAAPGADARLLGLEQDATSSTLLADIGGREVRFRLNAPGRHMAMNAVTALAAIAALGLDPVRAASALEGFAPLPGRGAHRRLMLPEGRRPGGPALLLDESYNANGASVRAALDVLRLQPATRRVAVLGDMLELGVAGPAEHAALAPEIVRSADLVFACGPLTRHLFDALPASLRGAHADDAAALAPTVAARIAPGDAILVKGSLGSRMRLIVAALDAMTNQTESQTSTDDAGSRARTDLATTQPPAGSAEATAGTSGTEAERSNVPDPRGVAEAPARTNVAEEPARAKIPEVPARANEAGTRTRTAGVAPAGSTNVQGGHADDL